MGQQAMELGFITNILKVKPNLFVDWKPRDIYFCPPLYSSHIF
jgi:hypothetical protein